MGLLSTVVPEPETREASLVLSLPHLSPHFLSSVCLLLAKSILCLQAWLVKFSYQANIVEYLLQGPLQKFAKTWS